MDNAEGAPGILAEAIRQFNQWRFYDCHETLEDLWRESGGKTPGAPPPASFYHGLIKLAAGFHHLLRGNYAGATALLEGGLELLATHKPVCQGIDVLRLVEETKACLEHIRALGPQRLARFDRALIPQVHTAPAASASGAGAQVAQGDADDAR